MACRSSHSWFFTAIPRIKKIFGGFDNRCTTLKKYYDWKYFYVNVLYGPDSPWLMPPSLLYPDLGTIKPCNHLSSWRSQDEVVPRNLWSLDTMNWSNTIIKRIRTQEEIRTFSMVIWEIRCSLDACSREPFDLRLIGIEGSNGRFASSCTLNLGKICLFGRQHWIYL